MNMDPSEQAQFANHIAELVIAKLLPVIKNATPVQLEPPKMAKPNGERVKHAR